MAASIRTVAAFKDSFFAYLKRGGFDKFNPAAGLVEFYHWAHEHFLDLQEYDDVTKSAFPAERTVRAWLDEYKQLKRLAQIEATRAARLAAAAAEYYAAEAAAQEEAPAEAAPVEAPAAAAAVEAPADTLVAVPASSPLRAYAHRTGLFAYLAGDASAKEPLSFDSFCFTVEHCIEHDFNVDSELLAELANTKLMQELYAEWCEWMAGAASAVGGPMSNQFELWFVLTRGEAKGGGIYRGYYDTREKALEAAPHCRQELLEDIRSGWRSGGWLTEDDVRTARVVVLG